MGAGVRVDPYDSDDTGSYNEWAGSYGECIRLIDAAVDFAHMEITFDQMFEFYDRIGTFDFTEWFVRKFIQGYEGWGWAPDFERHMERGGSVDDSVLAAMYKAGLRPIRDHVPSESHGDILTLLYLERSRAEIVATAFLRWNSVRKIWQAWQRFQLRPGGRVMLDLEKKHQDDGVGAVSKRARAGEAGGEEEAGEAGAAPVRQEVERGEAKEEEAEGGPVRREEGRREETVAWAPGHGSRRWDAQPRLPRKCNRTA